MGEGLGRGEEEKKRRGGLDINERMLMPTRIE